MAYDYPIRSLSVLLHNKEWGTMLKDLVFTAQHTLFFLFNNLISHYEMLRMM